mgnify:CR=1 FL=1
MALPFIASSMVPFLVSFLFVFALIFGLLSFTKMFSKNVNVMIALGFAIFAITYEPLVLALEQYIPIGAGILVVVFFIAFIRKALKGGEKKEGTGTTPAKHDMFPIALAAGIMLIVLGIVWNQIGGTFFGLHPDTVLWIIGIIFVLMIFWAAYKAGSGESQ